MESIKDRLLLKVQAKGADIDKYHLSFNNTIVYQVNIAILMIVPRGFAGALTEQLVEELKFSQALLKNQLLLPLRVLFFNLSYYLTVLLSKRLLLHL